MTSLTFYGGTGEIGGNKILLEDDGARLWLDFGMSFKQSGLYFSEFLQPKKYNGMADFLETGLLPPLSDMSGLYREDYLAHSGIETQPTPAYNGVLLSHAHADHSAYIHFLRGDIPIYASEITRRILSSMEDTGSGGFCEFINLQKTFQTRPNKRGEGITKVKGEEAKEARKFQGLSDNDVINIGGLKIEAIAVNHSIPGATGYLIHTQKGVIAYTGDLRFHGYGGELTTEFVSRAAEAEPVALICEGTRIDQTESRTERYVQDMVSDAVQKTESLVIANYPWKDIERLRSFYEAAKATGRKLALNLKQAYMIKQLQSTAAGAPALDDEHIVIYIDRKGWGLVTKPQFPPEMVEQDYRGWEREFLNYPNNVTCDDIHNHQSDFIIRIDFFDLTDLINIRPDESACYIRSVTEPFDEEAEIELKRAENWLRHFNLYPYLQVHASGHASGPEIKKLVKDINPGVVFPIHTESPECFNEVEGINIEIPVPGKKYDL